MRGSPAKTSSTRHSTFPDARAASRGHCAGEAAADGAALEDDSRDPALSMDADAAAGVAALEAAGPQEAAASVEERHPAHLAGRRRLEVQQAVRPCLAGARLGQAD